MFLVFGVAELVTHFDEPLFLFFLLPALWDAFVIGPRRKEPANRPLPAARLTPSSPWRFRGVTRVHVRSLATLLQIGLLQAVWMRRETPRVSFLMCPFCVPGALVA